MIKISDFLAAGQDQAISLPDLSAVLNLPERAVKQILNERLSGELILSSDKGYFLPSSEDEIREYVFRRKAVIKTAGAALKPFLKALNGR